MLTIQNLHKIVGMDYAGWIVTEASEELSLDLYRIVIQTPTGKGIEIEIMREPDNDGKYWLTATEVDVLAGFPVPGSLTAVDFQSPKRFLHTLIAWLIAVSLG